MAIAGYVSYVQAAGASTAITDEALTNTSGDIWEAGASKDLWDPTVTWTVEASEDSGSTYATLSGSEYTIDYILGRVTIDSYTTGSGNTANITDIRVDGAYFPKYKLGNAHSCDLSLGRELLDSAVFEDAGARKTDGRGSFSASVSQFEIGELPIDGSGGSEKSLLDILKDDDVQTVVVVVPTGTAADGEIRGWASLATDDISAPGDGMIEGSLEFEGSMPVPADSSQSTKPWNYK